MLIDNNNDRNENTYIILVIYRFFLKMKHMRIKQKKERSEKNGTVWVTDTSKNIWFQKTFFSLKFGIVHNFRVKKQKKELYDLPKNQS